MRIECDKCAAKYSIADEKVRGKTFKIRCKKCSNVIIVRDKAAGGDAAASSDGPDEDESEPAGWHLAIDGETVGPLSEAEVRQRYDAGQIDRSTSTWQEGFDDWVELGSIEMFADLPDRPSGRAAVVAAPSSRNDDPFASSGDDAFAASSGEYGGHSSHAPAAAAPAESPRVSAAAASLTGQRNENSVLFSLDSLKSVATARPSTAGPVRQAPSTTAPSSEGSGLIDIRAMGAMLGGSPGAPSHGGGPADDEVLPSFGGGGLGGLSVEPLVTEAPVIAAVAPPPPQRSNAPMYILIALLLVGLVGLGAYIFFKEPDAPQIIEKTVEVPGKVEEKADDKGDDDDAKDDDKDDDKGEKDDAKDETSGGETEGAAEGGEAGVAGTGTKKAGTGTKKVGDGKSTDTKSTDTKATDTKKTDTKKEPDVDCLLNPNLAKCKGGGGDSGGGDTKPAVDGSLPKKLGTAEISKGIAPVKAPAKACGPKNGAAAGTKVAIKFSVTGSTGAVASATATGEHAGTALGKCVEAESKKATFPKFQDAQQGFQFSFTM